jgi:hypothetical protein
MVAEELGQRDKATEEAHYSTRESQATANTRAMLRVVQGGKEKP